MQKDPLLSYSWSPDHFGGLDLPVGRHKFSWSGFLGVSSAFGLTAPAQLLKGGEGKTQGAKIAPRMLANSKWTTWNFSMAIYMLGVR